MDTSRPGIRRPQGHAHPDPLLHRSGGLCVHAGFMLSSSYGCGSVETRMPLSPFQNFKQEILSQNRAESTLLWTEWTAGSPDTLRAELTVKAFGGTYELQATYVPDDDVDQVSAGHVVKPAYLTSHLYVTFKDIPPEMSRSLRIHYHLRDSTSSFSSR